MEGKSTRKEQALAVKVAEAIEGMRAFYADSNMTVWVSSRVTVVQVPEGVTVRRSEQLPDDTVFVMPRTEEDDGRGENVGGTVVEI